jgi:D-alanine-D-alanine ligase-like ATP-grasp enzyme
MRICILNVDNQNSLSVISEFEPLADPSGWLNNHSYDRAFIRKKDAKIQIEDLLGRNYDLFLNLCDGAENEDRPGIEVVKMLEKANVAFTGAGSAFYDPSKDEMKDACLKSGVKFPKGINVFSIENIEEKIKGMSFPFIVKHQKSYNSVGMTKDSVVNDVNALKAQVNKMVDVFGGALIEEYIDGREFTALVVENANNIKNPFVFMPMEIVFPEGETFKHFDLKWKGHAAMKYVPCDDKKIASKISTASSSMFKAMNGTGYGRCDLRMNRSGELFMLEINPNCSIYFPKEDCSSADEILYYEKESHEKFTQMIIHSALNRKNRIL